MSPRNETPRLTTYLSSAADRELRVAPDGEVAQTLTAMVGHPEYPCLGARSVFRGDRAHIEVLEEMGGPEDVAELSDRLHEFGRDTDPDGGFASLIAVFRSPAPTNEEQFESLLWGVLRDLDDGDDRPWADGVSSDPTQPHFAFSHGGTAFFVVGLHPAASRIARRAPLPTLVFNLHQQFENLRAGGGFDRMRDAIRSRDTRLQGGVNPMAEDHGSSSEARQYSGREVPQDWVPRFTRREAEE